MLQRRVAFGWLALSAFFLFACSDRGKAPSGALPIPPKVSPPPAKVVDPAVADIPFDEAAPADPARMPTKNAVEPIEVSVRRIVVGFRGAKGATAGRSEAEAARRASRLVAAARKSGADFDALAKRFSEESDKKRGRLTALYRGPLEVDPKLVDAALSMGVGQVADPVKTAGGYLVLMRVDPQLIASAHILVIFQGSKLAKAALKLTKADARKRADKYAKIAKSGKESFHVLAGRFSDSPSKVRGGVISPVGPHKLIEGFEPYYEALKALKDNEVSDVVETVYGFHIIKRLPFQQIVVRHILIRHDEARTKPDTPRKKDEARALVAKLSLQARRGADFTELAKKYSEDGSAKDGGLLAPIARGQTVPRFEQYAFSLKVGQISDVVETAFGFHVIKRER